MGIRHRESTDQFLDRIHNERLEEESIRCPYCEEYYYQPGGDSELLEGLVTYHGEDGPVEIECQNEHCEKSFLVEEDVSRTYEVKKMGEEECGG